jgi:CIC family chloride channel protein
VATRDELNRQGLVLLLAILVGVGIGLVGSLFHFITHSIFLIKSSELSFLPHGESIGWLYSMIITSAMVLFALWLVRSFSKESAGSGVQEIEGVLEGKKELRWYRILPVKFSAGILSLSSGLELGREGPTIHLGGSIGRMLGIKSLNKDEVNILIAAGAAAGLSVAFNAPLAGIIFVIEEMRRQFNYSHLSVSSVIIASLASDLVLISLFRNVIDIKLPLLSLPEISHFWLFLALGAIFGALGVLFNRSIFLFLDFFKSVDKHIYKVVALIAALLGLLFYFIPALSGGGYVMIPSVFADSYTLFALLGFFVARFFITSLSYGIGVPGGIFAPMVTLGVIFGAIYAHTISMIAPTLSISPEVFAIVGMGALFSATVRAPLTGVVLVVEMTQEFDLLLPIIISALGASVVAHMLGGRPIYSDLLARSLKKE